MKITRDRPEPTKRKAMTPARRLRVFNAADGRCQCGCGEKLRPDWEVEHRIPLSIGGTEEDSNLEAWNAVCHQRKTSGEAAPRAKVKRIIAREDGTRRPRQAIPKRVNAWGPKGVRKIPTKKDRNPNTEEWTPARVAKLRELKARNYSAAQIAKALGGTTRCAVIGKLHQQGLTRDAVRANGGGMMAASPNKGVKTKALSIDLSPAELLRPRRFSWEDAAP